MRLISMICFFLLHSLLLCPSEATVTTVSNIVPKLDIGGSMFDAHDGNTLQFEATGPFYWYAMGYGKCLENGDKADGFCGQLSNNTVGVWRSSTLASGTWELLHSFTPSQSGWPKCTYYRSHLLQSPTTKKYVLWLNAQSGKDNQCEACPQGSFAKCFVVGTSSSPDGPFEYHGVAEGVRYLTEGGVGDFALFQDNDANRTSYVIYKRSGRAPGHAAHRMTLQRLQPNLLDADVAVGANVGIFGAPFVEAPAMFKRRGVYYALFGQCCAFCAHGSGIGTYTASSPLGPWTNHGNIGCKQHVPDMCGCGLPLPAVYNLSCPKQVTAVTFAQQNSVIVVGEDIVWTGDRWQSACAATVSSQGLPRSGIPGELDCVKAFDLQYWSVLRWDDKVVPPLPQQVVWEDEVRIQLPDVSEIVRVVPPPAAVGAGKAPLSVTQFNVSTPRGPVSAVLAVIDKPATNVHALPSTADGCSLRKPSETAAEAGCIFAINGGPFDPETGACLGTLVSKGRVFQIDPDQKYEDWGMTPNGVYVFGNLSASNIQQYRPHELISGAHGAMIVEYDKPTPSADTHIGPRSAVGVGQFGVLMLLTIDGVEGTSGMTLGELGELMGSTVSSSFNSHFPCHNAIAMIGGDSTTAWYQGKTISAGEQPVGSILCVMPQTEETKVTSSLYSV